VGIALFVNPRSQRNRRDPAAVHRLARALGDAGTLLSPPSEELPALALRLAADPPDVIAIHGGDGTVHVLLTALVPAFAGRPLPPFALLTGGTMNVVPRSLGLDTEPEGFLAGIVRDARAGRTPETLTRRCLQVGERFGFVFANGVFATFLEEFYAGGSYGAGRALWVGMRAVASGLVGGHYAAHALRPFRGGVTIDGSPLPGRLHTAISAATVSQVGLGFKVNHRADEDPERFSVVAVTASPLAMLADLAPVRLGQGFAPERAITRLASKLLLEPEVACEMPYTVDGDLYRTTAALAIAPGPFLRLIRPPPGLN